MSNVAITEGAEVGVIVGVMCKCCIMHVFVCMLTYECVCVYHRVHIVVV